MDFRIKHIKIENFRAIRQFDGDLHESMNVLFGENGVGKSTFVLALNYLLSWLIARIINPKGNGRVLTDDDITKGERYCRLAILLEDGTSWTLYRQRSTERAKSPQSEFHLLSGWTDGWVKAHRDESGNITEMPCVGIYDVNRSVVDVPQRLVHQTKISPLSVYTAKTTDFKTFFHWFREREDVENESFRTYYEDRNSSDGFVPDGQLRAVREAVAAVLPAYGNFHVRRHPRRFVMEKNGVEYDFARLSDGEKCYITLVASVAMRLAATHPMSDNPLSGNGVFIVDEIDLHLHPDWQRLVVDRLRAVFPNCQFVLTTHSPAVLSSVRTYDNERIFSVADGRVQRLTGKIFGTSVSDILLRDFAVPSIRAVDAEQIIDKVRDFLVRGDVSSPEYFSAKEDMLLKLDASDVAIARLLMEEAKIKSKNQI